MAILAVTEVWDSRSGEQSWKAQYKYARRFKVYVSDNTDHTTAILASGSVPARLAAHPTNGYALVESRKVSQDSSDPLVYFLDVSYNSVFDFDPASTNENPLLRPAIIELGFERATKAVREDLDGEAIDNSAGIPFDPPLEIEHSIPTLTITVNKAALSYATIATLQDCCNSDTWYGFTPGQVKIRGISVKLKQENGYLFWEYQWTLAVKWDGWRPTRVLDQGFHELDEDGVTPILIRDNFGNPLPSPSRLDGEGNKLDPAEDAVFLEFNMVREVAFAGIPIP